jgi:hypothetical protein
MTKLNFLDQAINKLIKIKESLQERESVDRIVEFEYKGVELTCGIDFTSPTFEDTENGFNGDFMICYVYVGNDNTNIVDVFDYQLLRESIAEKLTELN